MGVSVVAIAVCLLLLGDRAAGLKTTKSLQPAQSAGRIKTKSLRPALLPDLVVEKVWLDGGNRVVFRLKKGQQPPFSFPEAEGSHLPGPGAGEDAGKGRWTLQAKNEGTG